MSRKKSEPVGMDEVKDAVLAMLVERFDGEGLVSRRKGTRKCDADGRRLCERRRGRSSDGAVGPRLKSSPLPPAAAILGLLNLVQFPLEPGHQILGSL